MGRSPRTLRRALAFALAAAALVLVAGCGGGDDSTSADTSAGGGAGAELTGVEAAALEGIGGNIRYYNSIGGTVGEAMEAGGFAEFSDLTGVDVAFDYTDGTSTKFFAAQEQGGQIPWSLIQLPTTGEMLRAAEEGWLEPVDAGLVPVANVSGEFENEFAVPTGTTNGVVTVWNTEKWPLDGEHPEGAADLYDLEKFPGKRCMLGWAEPALEQALFADGVAPDELYPLEVQRAFDKLDTIRGETVWTYAPDDVIGNLLNGECDIGVVPQGRVFSAVNEDGAPLAIAWPGADYSVGWMAVPKGAPDPEAGQAALAFWAGSEQANLELAEQTSYVNQLTLLGEDDYPSELRDWLPLTDRPEIIVSDGQYWLENADRIYEEFSAWLGS